MSASLSAFIHQCLSEDKYGRQFVSEVEDRIESLNYAQLEGMHKVLTESAKGARLHTWKAANEEILVHVEKWRAIKGEEHRKQLEFETELLRKIREKEKNRLREIHAKESVIRQLRGNARKDAEKEIAELEFNRKATYTMEVHELVPKVEAIRLKLWKQAAAIFVIGCILCIAIGVVIKQPFVIVIGIGVSVMISLYLVRKGVKVAKIAPFDEDPVKIAESVDIREEELFMKSMNQLRKSDEEYKQRMLLDKEERRKRKAERKEKEMIRLALLAAGDHKDDEDEDDEEDDEENQHDHIERKETDINENKENSTNNNAEADEKFSSGVHNEESKEDLSSSDDKEQGGVERGIPIHLQNDGDDKSIMDVSTLSGSCTDSVSDKKMNIYDINDELANAATSTDDVSKFNPTDDNKQSPSLLKGPPGANPRGPPGSNPRDSKLSNSRGPPGANPRGSDSRGPPGSNPRDLADSPSLNPSSSKVEKESKISWVDSVINVENITVTDFKDSLSMVGDASVIIRVEDNAGNVIQELETDSQKLSGDSLFWRFGASTIRDNVDTSNNNLNSMSLKDLCNDAISSLNFLLSTVQDGEKKQQAIFSMNASDVKEFLLKCDAKEDKSPCILEGVLCRNDIVNVCTISVMIYR